MLRLSTPLASAILAASLLANFAPASAQDIDNILVTASRLPDTTLQPDYILDRQEIDLLSPPNVTALLRAIPHLYVYENGNPGGLAFASVRGGDPNFLLVLIDGVAVNDPTNSRGGGFDFNQLNPGIIERVEVYRGGISSVHGGEALSGVIHFFTRKLEGLSVSSALGNAGQRQLSAAAGKSLAQGVDVLAMVSRNEAEPSSAQRMSNDQALLKLTGEVGSFASRISLSASRQSNRGFPEDSGGDLSTLGLTESRDSEQQILGALFSYTPDESLVLSLQGAWANHEEDVQSPGIAPGVLQGIPPTDITSRYRQSTIDVNARKQFSQALGAVAGATLRTARGANDGFVDFGFPLPVDYRLEQETRSTYVEGELSGDVWALTLGARYDEADGFDGEASIRASANYAPYEGLTLTADYSEGFKLPSFFALAQPLVGNPDLMPEYSKSYSLRANLRLSQAMLVNLSAYDVEYTNLVDFDPEAFTNINRGEVNARGAELDFRWEPSQTLTLSGAASYLDSDTPSTETALRRRPQWMGQLQLVRNVAPFEMFVAVRYRGSSLDSSVLTGLVPLDAYSSLDAGVRRSFRPDVSVYLNAENLLNEDRQDAIGFNSDRRLLRVGIDLHF